MEETNKTSVDSMEVKEKEDLPPKRVKTQETFDSLEKKDRISLLPDCLIIDEILSRLPSTKHAIRTGTLSKRWQHLWTSLPALIFNDYDMKRLSDNHHFSDEPLPDFYTSVDKTLSQCRHRQLKNLSKFSIDANYERRYESHVENWIHFATGSNVQQLDLYLMYTESEEQFVLKDDSFFINSHFTHLYLAECGFYPFVPINWSNLTHLTISNGQLNEHLIANILSGSPLLDTLTLKTCYGFSRLDITSKSVKNFVLFGYADHKDQYLYDIFEINAPYISSLTIIGSLLLWDVLLLDVSSLVTANLDYIKLGNYEATCKEEEEDTLKSLIQNLRHVKELKIGNFCMEALSRLEAKGFVFSSNLKLPDVIPPLESDSDSDERMTRSID